MLALVTDADTPLSLLPLLSETAWEKILEQSRGAATPPSSDTLLDLIDAQVARTPNAVAVEHRGDTLTFSALDHAAERLAGELAGHGVGPEVAVGVLLDRGLDLIVAVVAILKAGGAYVPLDPRYPRERLAFMMEDAGIGIVVGTRSAVAGLGSEHTVLLDDRDERPLLDALSAAPVAERAGGGSLAYVIYT